MNKHLTRDDLQLSPATKAAMRRAGLLPEYPGAPFSKRPEGRARRIERRQVRARKAEWLNS